MINQHLTDDDIQAFLRGGLPGPQRIAADDHLAQCEPCRRRTQAALPQAAPAAVQEAFLGGATPAHPEFEVLAALVVGELAPDARAGVQAHLAGCRQCRGEVQAMDAMRREIRDSPAKVYVPAGAARSGPRWTDLFRAPAWRPLLAAGAAALLGVAVLVGHRPVPSAGPTPVPLTPSVETFREPSQGGTETHKTGVAETPEPDSPTGAQVTADRPTLRWSGLFGADHYRVTLRAGGRANVLAASPPLSQTQWTVPRPLTPGVTYQWTVRAYHGVLPFGPPSATAAFRVGTKTG